MTRTTLPAHPIATDPSIVGTRCDDTRAFHHLLTAGAHTGCPGWWGADTTDPQAATCYCPCHANGNGWPSWEQLVRRSAEIDFGPNL